MRKSALNFHLSKESLGGGFLFAKFCRLGTPYVWMRVSFYLKPILFIVMDDFENNPINLSEDNPINLSEDIHIDIELRIQGIDEAFVNELINELENRIHNDSDIDLPSEGEFLSIESTLYPNSVEKTANEIEPLIRQKF